MTSPITQCLIAACIAGCLAACDITPVRSMWALRNVDPMTTDPAAIRLAIRIPQEFRPDPSAMAFTGTLNETQGKLAQSTNFAIVRDTSTKLPSWMRQAGAPLYAYKIADSDLPAFRAFQKEASAAKASGRSGSLSVDANVCRLSKRVPDSIPISTFIATQETDGFVPLVMNADLLDEITPAELNKLVPMC